MTAASRIDIRLGSKFPIYIRRLSGRQNFARCSSLVDWTSEAVRSTFLQFFIRNHGHKHVASSSVVPWQDPSLAFVNAGMNQFDLGLFYQFKNVFLGLRPPPYAAVANSQKCIRVGGKHNDLETVGKDGYHHTFFEMLGNWSFDAYGKEEACKLALSLLVDVYGISKDRLLFTYFGGDSKLGLPSDTDTKELWIKLGVPAERILEFSATENFWVMGSVGPCGPCTEIHYDHVPGRPLSQAVSLVNKGESSLTELWNIVFIKYNRNEEGVLLPLQKTFIDTGMGLERLLAVLNRTTSNYDSDLFAPIFELVQKVLNDILEALRTIPISTKAIESSLIMRACLLLPQLMDCYLRRGDILLPSASQKLRNVIHRFCHHSQKSFGLPGAEIIPSVCDVVIDSLKSGYPELPRSRTPTIAVLLNEARRYEAIKSAARAAVSSIGGQKAIDDLGVEKIHENMGLPQLIEEFNRLIRLGQFVDGTVPLAESCRLCLAHDVSPDLFKKICVLKNLRCDVKALESRLGDARQNTEGDAGMSSNFRSLNRLRSLMVEANIPPTDDSLKWSYTFDETQSLYRTLSVRAKILFALGKDFQSRNRYLENTEVVFVLDYSPFHPEAGGQVSDTGFVRSSQGLIRVDNVYAVGGAHVVHEGTVLIGFFEIGHDVMAEVDPERRTKVTCNHTGVHLLNAGLRKVSEHDSVISQKSSWVGPDYARFDFGFNKDIFKQQALDETDEILKVEDWVNAVIAENRPVNRTVTSWSQIRDLPGLVTVPGEVYSENNVYLIEVDRISREPCCGTHVRMTGHMGKFRIIQNRSVQLGVRSVKFVTGANAEIVDENDMKYSIQFRECWKRVQEEQDTNPLVALETLKEVRKLFKNVQDSISYRKKREFDSELSAAADSVRKTVNKRIVVLMKDMVEQIVKNSEGSSSFPAVGFLDFGPECCNLDVPLIKATRLCPGKLPVALFAISKNRITGRCVVPETCQSATFTAEKWMMPLAEFFKAELKPPKGQNGAQVVGLKGPCISSSTDFDELKRSLLAGVDLTKKVFVELSPGFGLKEHTVN
ncbi:unnamed protein product [Notodromas monacha]|uniref:Alanine--tRNA ligase n=1 Tax=Notodromas monacha TaxID=399045 RepID=A0A7R9GFU0_9CRUS|nr:unnamed protein product [Notodromas monacha]CAG0919240.1 unnamed protein product [Notodromas monacha]